MILIQLKTEEREPVKLCSRNHRGTQRTTIWFTPKALKDLAWLQDFYEAILQRRVSMSLIVRRSLELLVDQMHGLARQPDPEKITQEEERMKRQR